MIKSYYFLSQKTPSCMFDRFWIYLYLLSLATAVFKNMLVIEIATYKILESLVEDAAF